MKKEQREIEALVENDLIDPESVNDLMKVGKKFSISVTPHLIELMKSSSPTDKEALSKQFLPSVEELKTKALELRDPIGDNTYEKVKGVIHRYPDRCLLMPITVCPAYCRFCFRREKVGQKEQTLSKVELENAYAYIAKHKEIWEVIITGGDPLILKPKILNEMLNRLARIEHLEVIRIHTRVPVVDPKRITDQMVDSLKTNKTLYVVLHANHPSELSKPVIESCARFVDAGIPMLSQTVLLKGINDDPQVMGKLMRALVKNRIKPYYLHHGDLAEGTAHFRTTIKAGQALMKALRGRYSGLCQPTYMLDIPGGYGKIPIHHAYLEKKSSLQECYSVEDYEGNIHQYTLDGNL